MRVHSLVSVILSSFLLTQIKVYFIEIDELSSSSKRAGVLSDFVYRRLEELKLAKYVAEIDTGKVEITPAEHKASGVAYVVQAVGLSREDKPLSAIKVKLNEAIAKVREREDDDSCLPPPAPNFSP